MLLQSWINLQQELPMLAHYIGVGITKIQEYVNKGRKTRAYALAMGTDSFDSVLRDRTTLQLSIRP